MKIITAINKVEKIINGEERGYIVNPFWDPKISIVHIVEKMKDINYVLEGWHLWVVKKGSNKKPCFLQLVRNEYGLDHHLLTEDEIYDFLEVFLDCEDE